MVEASPDVVHPTRRLGRRPPKNHVALNLADFVSAPSHPAAADHFSLVRDWGLYNNDRVGICGPTSVANSRKLVTLYATGTEVSPTQHDTDDLYRRSGNPGFTGDPNNPGEDNGVDMQTMCEALLADGIGGIKPLGFAKVDVGDLGLLDAAVDIFGFLLLGVDLEVAQQAQTDRRLWDYQSSPDWGGHAVLYGRYLEDAQAASERRGLVTWAEVVDMTDLFIERQLGEAWAVIWPEVWDHPVFDQNFDKAGFVKSWQDITNKPWPGPAPAPSPTPSPTPAPASVEITLEPDVLARVQHVSAGDINRWMNHHFRSYFKMH